MQLQLPVHDWHSDRVGAHAPHTATSATSIKQGAARVVMFLSSFRSCTALLRGPNAHTKYGARNRSARQSGAAARTRITNGLRACPHGAALSTHSATLLSVMKLTCAFTVVATHRLRTQSRLLPVSTGHACFRPAVCAGAQMQLRNSREKRATASTPARTAPAENCPHVANGRAGMQGAVVQR